jgi:hypothetical protein
VIILWPNHTAIKRGIDLNQLDKALVNAIIKMARFIFVDRIITRDSHMNQETTGAEQDTRVPVMQRILDNPFLLLFIGVVVPTVFYIVWGIMELVSIPVAP